MTLHFSSVTQGEIWPSDITSVSRVPGFAYQVWHLFGMFAVKIPTRGLRKWLWRDLRLALVGWEPSETKPCIGESFASVQEQPCVQPAPGGPCSPRSERSAKEWAGHGTRLNTVTEPAGKSCTGTERRAERWRQRAGRMELISTLSAVSSCFCFRCKDVFNGTGSSSAPRGGSSARGWIPWAGLWGASKAVRSPSPRRAESRPRQPGPRHSWREAGATRDGRRGAASGRGGRWRVTWRGALPFRGGRSLRRLLSFGARRPLAGAQGGDSNGPPSSRDAPRRAAASRDTPWRRRQGGRAAASSPRPPRPAPPPPALRSGGASGAARAPRRPAGRPGHGLRGTMGAKESRIGFLSYDEALRRGEGRRGGGGKGARRACGGGGPGSVSSRGLPAATERSAARGGRVVVRLGRAPLPVLVLPPHTL